MRALVLAAGLGTRLKPLTDTRPKALVEVGGEPMIATLLGKLAREGFDEVVVNVHHFADMLEDWLSANDFGIRVSISSERDLLRDTGGAVRHAGALLASSPGGRFLVHNVDILSECDLNLFWKAAEGYPATLLVSDRPSGRYLLFDSEMRLVGWTNLSTGQVKSPYPGLDPSRCIRRAFSGIHSISTSLLPLMDSWPEKFSIVDFYLDICSRYCIKGFDVGSVPVRDLGKIADLK